MQDFQVNVYPIKNQTFLTSFVHPLTKRKVRQSFHSREEATAFKKYVEVKFKRKSVDKYVGLTVEELIVLFNNGSPKNPFTHRYKHLIDFADTFGNCQIEELTYETMKVWLDQVQHENGLKQITMRGLKAKLTTLFRFLEDKEIISESPLTEIYYEKPTPSVSSRNILNEAEIDLLLAAIKDYSPGYLYPIIRMFAETGGKINEVLELTWKDVDAVNMTVTFEKRDKIQTRTLTISEELVRHLPKKNRKSNLVFNTYYGEAFTRKKLQLAVNEFKRKKSYKGDWVPVDLRHSLAVHFLVTGGSLKDLQYILGHNNVFDTKKLYGEVSGKAMAEKSESPFE